MKLSRREEAELRRRCPELEINDRPKVTRARRKAGSFPESLAGLKPGRTIIVVNNKIVWHRKKEAL